MATLEKLFSDLNQAKALIKTCKEEYTGRHKGPIYYKRMVNYDNKLSYATQRIKNWKNSQTITSFEGTGKDPLTGLTYKISCDFCNTETYSISTYINFRMQLHGLEIISYDFKTKELPDILVIQE